MKQFKIREIANNKGNPVYGITIPNYIAEKFSNVCFTFETKEEGILMKSGLIFSLNEKKISGYGWGK